MTTGLSTHTALHRTMRLALMNALGNEELVDRALDSVMITHPHLSLVWDRGTCDRCRAILTELERLESHGFCECCAGDIEFDEYADNLRRYGAE